MKWFNKLRTKQVLTFPVETMAMVYDPKTNDIIDKDYKDFTAEMYAEGHSFFTYISDSADSLASCCRLKNELTENTFNPTSGLTGVMTGSCNVITLNINRIVQNWYALDKPCSEIQYDIQGEMHDPNNRINSMWMPKKEALWSLKGYLVRILERIYKYHIAYKTMLYDQEDLGMFAASNGGYIYISKLYSTIGINGLNEAARFLGFEVSNNPEYIKKGIVGMYDGFEVIMSNNMAKDATGTTKYAYCDIRGKKAIAFAGQINEVEALRAEKRFKDIIRGLDTFGAKVIDEARIQVVKVPLSA